MQDPSTRYIYSNYDLSSSISAVCVLTNVVEIRLSDIIKQCTNSTDHVKLVGEKGEAALAASHDVLKRLKDDGCDLVIYRLKFSAFLVIGFHTHISNYIDVYKIGSVESSSAVRTGRQLDQRQATETECTSLSEACSTHVNAVDITLQSTWTEAFKNTAPHQLTSDIQEIQGISHLRVTL